MNGSLAAWFNSWSKQTPDEVDVHQLDDGTHPGHGRADAEPDDRGLGDRGVAHAVAELVAQTSGQPEDVAALPDVDAREEHPVVAGQFGLECRPDCVHGAEHRRVSAPVVAVPLAPATRGGQSGSAGRRSGPASRRAASTAHVEFVGHRRFERLDLAVTDSGIAKPALVRGQWIARLPSLDLLC